MNQIAFVSAAYVAAIGATVVLTAWAWLSMRRAERAVDGLGRHGR
jgi:hypothetical protein